MKKILHISQSAGYGVTIYVETLIKGLTQSNLHQDLLGSQYYNKPIFQQIVDKLITIPMDREITIKDLSTVLQCRKIIKQEQPDIIYCHSAKAGIYGRLACIGTNIKVIYNPHGWSFNMHCSKLKRLFYKTIEILFSYITDKIICISEYERNSTPILIPKDKLVVIRNGINIEENKKLLEQNPITRNNIGIPSDAYVIGIVARISIQKGQDIFVRIAKEIKQNINNAYFIIVGGKSDDLPIEELIKENGLENSFLITGEVTNAIQYVSLFDVAVLTSRWEGFGLVLPEYMVARKPIVAYSVDAIPEIIKNNVNGILVTPESITEFANAIYKIYSQPKLAQSFIKNASRTVVKEFDIKRVINEHKNLFKQL